ncbi:MAG: hypothetical protein EOO28_00855 [Comamonadaceae bacterium]|nr:MAG: hypothetical protein EOO28_00855 [Comamonadaceae bacterium]
MNPEKMYTFLSRTSTQPDVTVQEIEASRYALLRRISPCLRHHMVRHLQPISMIYEVMDHKLSTPEPDLANLHRQADKINNFARAAMDQCLDMSTWLAPDRCDVVPLGAGVKECVDLLAASMNFRGYRLVNLTGNIALNVRRDALRMVLIAALLAGTDSLDQPANVLLNASAGDRDYLTLAMVVDRVEGVGAEVYEDGYRKLTWRDVEVLAAAEDVFLTFLDNRMTMSFAVESAPLVN